MHLIDPANGNALKIYDSRQASVLSESLPGEEAAALRGEAFIVSARCSTAASPTGGLLSIANNEQGTLLTVTRIYICPHTLTDTDLLVTQQFDPVITNGEDISGTGVINKNRGSAIVFNLSVKRANTSTALDLASGIEYHAIPISSRTPNSRSMNGANVLPFGKAIGFGWETESGSNATDNQVIAFSVNIEKRLAE